MNAAGPCPESKCPAKLQGVSAARGDFDMLDTASQVRDLAYQLWVEQGRPVGRDMENWFEAERLLSETRQATVPKNKKEKKAQEKKSKAKRK
jgi:hypothetical protein